MFIRQRSTFADDLLLRLLCHYDVETRRARLLPLARFWNQEIRPARALEDPPVLARSVILPKRLLSVFTPWSPR